MKKAIIFDFDGVIINSSEVQKQAFLESYRLIVGEGTPSFQVFLSHSGDSLPNIFQKMGLPLEMVEPYRRISRERIDFITIHDGMRDLLVSLKNAGFKCGLCTGKDRERTVEILNSIGLIDFFAAIVCSDDGLNPKPHPESLFRTVKLLGTRVDDSWMIGDAKNDIACAKAAGMECIAVTWGDTKKEELERESPDYMVDSIPELYEYVMDLVSIK